MKYILLLLLFMSCKGKEHKKQAATVIGFVDTMYAGDYSPIRHDTIYIHDTVYIKDGSPVYISFLIDSQGNKNAIFTNVQPGYHVLTVVFHYITGRRGTHSYRISVDKVSTLRVVNIDPITETFNVIIGAGDIIPN